MTVDLLGADHQERSETRIPSAVAGVSVMGTLKTVTSSGVRRRLMALCLSDDTGQTYIRYSPKSHWETSGHMCVKRLFFVIKPKLLSVCWFAVIAFRFYVLYNYLKFYRGD